MGIGIDAESEEGDNNEPVPSDYNSEELEFFRKEKHKEVNDQLDMFLELEKGMCFKNLKEAKRVVMVRLKELEDEGRNWKKKFNPYYMELYTDYNMIVHYCEVKFNRDQGYEVVEGEDTHVVYLGRKKCMCRIRDLTGIPYPHAIKAYITKNQKIM
ncbi:hypothetical protein BC332_28083 [Capsicum chinense]|nr:hypothetical protein BC332_28083 [Capsicum chinense]